jgi:Xaa-Pro aminopeptidase
MDKMEGGIAVFRADAFDRDFYYLTGFDEPGAACLIIPDAEEKFILFVRPQSPARIVWTGKRHGVEEAVKVFGADKAYPIAQFERILPRHLVGKNRIYCSFNNKELTDTLTQMMRRPRDNWPKQISNILPHVHDMRMIKDSCEIKLMRKAIDITCDALLETMKAAEPGIYIGEHSLDSLLENTRRSKARKEDIAAFLEKVKPVFEKYMNIGVRIEDDILVTEDGHENLSSKAPKTIKEIEKWMKKKSYLNK